ncbi:hypothetical protein [Hwangdonia seohaensis]|uniref:Uncharacterized protein n=1 Tax=Hwangdonia seohaensis TaxID=1240727 RepID=A0ABW3RBJ9_9FLAO|nr:hypothetical protein [Hwangdonia seohaensis]
MTRKKKSFIYSFVITVIFSLSTNNTVAQETSEVAIDMTDVLTINSPSNKFKSIHLQAHKGLPRFGAHNQYRFINKYNSLGLDRPKNTLIKEGFTNYANMVKMKYMARYYNDIDNTYITALTHENRDNKKDIHSFTAQNHLLRAMHTLVSEEIKRTYFCDIEKNPKCRFTGKWGGTRDEFVAQEKYATFVAANLEELRNWSVDFFKNNDEIGYFVTRHKFGQYDFDKGGFWVQLPPHSKEYFGFGILDEAFFFEFFPEESFENAYLNSIKNTYPKILLPISADKAEDFLNNRGIDFNSRRPTEFIYSAIKVRIVYKELNTANITIPSPMFTYQFEDRIIEFYQDIELTKKIGEISLNNPVYSKL